MQRMNLGIGLRIARQGGQNGPAVWWSARGDRFGGSGGEAFATPAEGPGEPSELDSPLEGDGPSARATPLANPTATQADSNNALRGQLHTSRPGRHALYPVNGRVGSDLAMPPQDCSQGCGSPCGTTLSAIFTVLTLAAPYS
jgi:hypothetical protein